MSVQNRIEQYVAAIEAHGYIVNAEPVVGQEEQFYQSLVASLNVIRLTMESNAERYGFRGKSRRALAALHSARPNPGFGIEVR